MTKPITAAHVEATRPITVKITNSGRLAISVPIRVPMDGMYGCKPDSWYRYWSISVQGPVYVWYAHIFWIKSATAFDNTIRVTGIPDIAAIQNLHPSNVRPSEAIKAGPKNPVGDVGVVAHG